MFFCALIINRKLLTTLVMVNFIFLFYLRRFIYYCSYGLMLVFNIKLGLVFLIKCNVGHSPKTESFHYFLYSSSG